MEWDPVVEAFLDEPRFGVLGTINPDGSVHQTVMWYRRDGGNIIMNTKMGRRKPLNLFRDKRVSLCIEDGGRYVTITGLIEINDNSAVGVPDMAIMTERYEGPERTAELMRDEYNHQHRIVLTLTPDKVDAHGFS